MLPLPISFAISDARWRFILHSERREATPFSPAGTFSRVAALNPAGALTHESDAPPDSGNGDVAPPDLGNEDVAPPDFIRHLAA